MNGLISSESVGKITDATRKIGMIFVCAATQLADACNQLADAWYVLAADVPDKIEAQRIAAIINHQGPQIPARVFDKSDSYRVVAGPFNDGSEAQKAAKRLKIDLEIDGIVMEPIKNE